MSGQSRVVLDAELRAAPGEHAWHAVGPLRPLVEAGIYAVTGDLVVKNDGASDAGATLDAARRFRVSAPQCVLPADAVEGLYPPPGQRSGFGTTLPTVVLRQPTLPWERDADGEPWLAIVLVTEAEERAGTATLRMSLSRDAALALTAGVQPPSLTQDELEPDEQTAAVTALEIDAAALFSQLPPVEWLHLTAHVRHTRSPAPAAGDPPTTRWSAVVLGSRFPQPGRNRAMLVSLEGHGALLKAPPVSGRIRLIVLAEWSFVDEPSADAVVSPRANLESLLGGLTPRLPRALDAVATDAVGAVLARGYVPLPSTDRSGLHAFSLYRGPLISEPATLSPLPSVPTHSDALLRVDRDSGVWDVSYASAWQLGRLLALRDGAFARSVFEWRRSRRRARALALSTPEASVLADPAANLLASLRRWDGIAAPPGVGHPTRRDTIGHLARVHAGLDPAAWGPADPAEARTILDTLSGWLRLEDVPFHYLVPHAALCPEESLTVFHLDPEWLRALALGALSVGASDGVDAAHDAVAIPALLDALPLAGSMGVLLHSPELAGWAGLQVRSPNLRARRDARLSPHHRLVLFEPGDPGEVTVAPPVEALHLAVRFEPGRGFLTGGIGKRAIPVPVRGDAVDWKAFAGVRVSLSRYRATTLAALPADEQPPAVAEILRAERPVLHVAIGGAR